MNNNQEMRNTLIYFLEKGNAHITLEAALKDFPCDLSDKIFPPIDHSAWQLLYHIWICQWDILDFIRNPNYKSLEYPSGYWPQESGPQSSEKWNQVINDFKRDQKELIKIIKDPQIDLFAPIPHGDGQTIFKEAILIVDHNSYHIGQLIDLRMLLGIKVKDW